MPRFNVIDVANWQPPSRTLTINGSPINYGKPSTFPPAAADGYDYFEVGPGTYDYSSFYWYLGAGSSGGGGAGGTTTGDTCTKPDGQICHEFFAADNSRNQLIYVNEFAPSKNWTLKVNDTGQNSPRAIQVVDNAKARTGKAVLVSTDKGFAEFDATTGAPLTRVANSSAVTSAIRVPNDGTSKLPPGTTVLLRDLSPTQLDFVDTTGAALLPSIKMTFAAGGFQLRKLERNPTTGNFSFTKYSAVSPSFIYEVTEQGNLVAKISLSPNSENYNAIWVAGGMMQTSTGSSASIVTFDRAGTVSASVGSIERLVKDASGATIFTAFFAGFSVLPNGNMVVANWLGHVDSAQFPNTPELLEFTSAGQLAWSWGNQTLATWITDAYVVR